VLLEVNLHQSKVSRYF